MDSQLLESCTMSSSWELPKPLESCILASVTRKGTPKRITDASVCSSEQQRNSKGTLFQKDALSTSFSGGARMIVQKTLVLALKDDVSPFEFGGVHPFCVACSSCSLRSQFRQRPEEPSKHVVTTSYDSCVAGLEWLVLKCKRQVLKVLDSSRFLGSAWSSAWSDRFLILL